MATARKAWIYGGLLALGWLALLVFATSPREGPPVPPGAAVLDLRLSAKGYVQLQALLQQARTTRRRPDDWVAGTLHTEEGAARCRVRLRGDQEAHWKKRKFSLRVKLRGASTFRGCDEFNLIVPWDRNYFSEMYAEWWNRRFGLVPCASDLVWLRINGRALGYYAFVEELGEAQLERNGLPFAPVFKGSRRGHLQDERVPWHESVVYSLPFFHAKASDAPLHDEVAHLLTTVFRELRQVDATMTAASYRRLAHLLDLERWAAYAAVSRVLGPHAESPHNVTVYFNSATGLFEPVLLDPFAVEELEVEDIDRGFAASFNVFNRELLSTPSFFALRKEALREVVAAKDEALARYQQFAPWIRYLAEDPLLDLDDPEWPSEPRRRWAPLEGLRSTSQGKYAARLRVLEDYLTRDVRPRPIERHHGRTQPIAHLEVTVLPAGRTTLALRGDPGVEGSIQLTELTVTGPGASSVRAAPAPDRQEGRDRRWTLQWNAGPAVEAGAERTIDLTGFDPDRHQLVPRVRAGAREPPVFLARSDARRMALDFLDRPVEELIRAASDLSFRLEPDRIVVPPGEYVVRAPLVLPRERRLVLEAGVRIRFAPEASLISYGPLTVAGTAEAPVVLDALDPGRGWGVVAVLATNARAAPEEAPRRSEVRHLIYARSRGATLNGIHYTGGLSFFYSDVSIERSLFLDAGEDDALNVKRASVSIRDCLFYGSPSDAMDLDWCGGEVRGCLIVGSGGDGIDLSGAEDLTLAGNAVLGAADKGVSVGEASRPVVEDNLLVACLTGIASKDRSLTASRRNALIACGHAFRAYQKKSIFGPARLESHGDLVADCGARDAAQDRSQVEVRDPAPAQPDLVAPARRLAAALAGKAPAAEVHRRTLDLLGARGDASWDRSAWVCSEEAWSWTR